MKWKIFWKKWLRSHSRYYAIVFLYGLRRPPSSLVGIVVISAGIWTNHLPYVVQKSGLEMYHQEALIGVSDTWRVLALNITTRCCRPTNHYNNLCTIGLIAWSRISLKHLSNGCIRRGKLDKTWCSVKTGEQRSLRRKCWYLSKINKFCLQTWLYCITEFREGNWFETHANIRKQTVTTIPRKLLLYKFQPVIDHEGRKGE